MIHILVATYDIKTGVYARPTAFITDAQAVRSFGEAVNDKTTEFNKHPEDYSIFNIGSYDDNTGEIKPSKPVQLAQAVVLIDTAAA